MSIKEIKTEVLVLGGGPGGYSAAFRAADLGKKVTLVERYPDLGGVCLNVGCIPSKSLLHAAYVLNESKALSEQGVMSGSLQINLDKLRDWKAGVIRRLSMGIKSLARQRKVELVTGVGNFTSAHQVEVINNAGDSVFISFEQAIVATGSLSTPLPFAPKSPLVMDSTDALKVAEIPKQMLIIGGGIIGLEMAIVYGALGSKVTIVELMEQLFPGIDADITEPLKQYNAKRIHKIMLATKVTDVTVKDHGLWVTFADRNGAFKPEYFDRVLVAVGRKPNSKSISAEKIGIALDQRGFIVVNDNKQTTVDHIYAVGDVVGNPMLAHKAVAEGRLVAEIISGFSPGYQIKNIPSVVYTDPEAAVVGLSEVEAQAKGILYGKAIFPWIANGRSLSLGRKEGLTKLLFDPASKKIIGGSIVGPNAGELIAEIALAITLGATAKDISHIVHPHPTLSETIMMASEVFLGTVTDLYTPKL